MIDLTKVEQVLLQRGDMTALRLWAQTNGLVLYTDLVDVPAGSKGLYWQCIVPTPVIGKDDEGNVVELPAEQKPMEWLTLSAGAQRLALPPGMPPAEVYSFPLGSCSSDRERTEGPPSSQWMMAPIVAFALPGGVTPTRQ